MSSAAVPESNSRNGFVVVTHVIPPAAAGPYGAGAGPGVPTLGVSNVGIPNVGVPNIGVPNVTPITHINPATSSRCQLRKFLKVQPKSLGVVQIMVGVMMFMFAIVLTVYNAPFSIITGIPYWGALIYIIAGSLTVAAEKNLNTCLVKGSLGMNVVSAITAGLAVIFFSLDFVVQMDYYWCNDYYECMASKQFLTRGYGISGVLLVFSLLQFLISIFISAFGCKATCCSEPAVPFVTVAPNHATCCSVVSPFHGGQGQQDMFYITNPHLNMNYPSAENPPAYSPASANTEELK